MSGNVVAREEVLSELEEEFSLDEHLLERISVLEEALKRTTETVEHLLGIVRRQEEQVALAEAGLATVRELLERKQVFRSEEWDGTWARHRDFRLLALDKRDRFLGQRDRILSVHEGAIGGEFERRVDEAAHAFGALELERGLDTLEEAFRLDDENYELAHFLGEAFFNSGQPDRAILYFERLLDLQPEHYEGLVYSGVILHESGDDERAEELLRQAVSLYPESFLPHFSLGAIYASDGELERATLHLGKAVAIDPVPQALYLLGRCFHESGRSTAAIRCLEDTVRKSPEFEEAYHQLGLVYLDRKWNRKALAAFRQAHRLNPRRLRYRELVRYLSGNGDSPLPDVGGDAAEAMRRGEEALEADQPAAAYRWFVEALESEPDHPALLTYFALSCLALGRPQEIERAVLKVVDDAPGEMLLSTAYAAWIEALRVQGRFREGNRVGRRLLEQGNSNFSKTIAYYEMASNLAEMEEDLDRALEFALRAIELAPQELEQFPLAALGWVHYKRKEYSQAVEFLGRSLQLAPSASTLTQLGMALLAAGEEEQARLVLDQAGALRGRSESLEFKMMECLRESNRFYSRLHSRSKP